ncbi:hypothetical protein DEM27_30400 [Metarhizobium album]|uniref:Uncharacterized protein n=1 Tax=Metarhizobium album TaxID=2182425 RepID=A0A2U2DGR7_9HYPH|nr:hypothetical protein DEM27_30400 [Rhizobium album]
MTVQNLGREITGEEVMPAVQFREVGAVGRVVSPLQPERRHLQPGNPAADPGLQLARLVRIDRRGHGAGQELFGFRRAEAQVCRVDFR